MTKGNIKKRRSFYGQVDCFFLLTTSLIGILLKIILNVFKSDVALCNWSYRLDICWLQFQNTHKAGSVLFKCNWATHIVFHLAWFFQSEDSFSKNICSPVLAKASVSFGLGRVLDVGVIEQVLRRYVKTGSREVHHTPLWSSRSLF